MNSRVMVALNTTAPRKMRRALTSRRWEKKMRKFLSAQLGYEVLGIERPEPERALPKPTPKLPGLCDFCNSDDPQWAYPAKDFVDHDFAAEQVANLVSSSMGGWAACDACHDLIESGDRVRLAAHTVGTMLCAHPEMDEHADSLFQMVSELHAQFFDSRRGAAVPVQEYRP